MNFMGSARNISAPGEQLTNLLRDLDLRVDRLEGAYSGPYNPGVSLTGVATVADLPPDHTDGQSVYVMATGDVYTSQPGPGGTRVWQPGGTLPTW